MNAQKFLSEKEVAELLNLKVATLRAWRLRGSGPPYRKLGSAVRYPLDELQDWLNKQPHGGSQPSAKQALLLEGEVA